MALHVTLRQVNFFLIVFHDTTIKSQFEPCDICNKEFSIDDDNKKYHKVRDHCHYTGEFKGPAHSICNLRYKTPKEIPVVFHNGSTYDYYFIIKQLAK